MIKTTLTRIKKKDLETFREIANDEQLLTSHEIISLLISSYRENKQLKSKLSIIKLHIS